MQAQIFSCAILLFIGIILLIIGYRNVDKLELREKQPAQGYVGWYTYSRQKIQISDTGRNTMVIGLFFCLIPLFTLFKVAILG